MPELSILQLGIESIVFPVGGVCSTKTMVDRNCSISWGEIFRKGLFVGDVVGPELSGRASTPFIEKIRSILVKKIRPTDQEIKGLAGRILLFCFGSHAVLSLAAVLLP